MKRSDSHLYRKNRTRVLCLVCDRWQRALKRGRIGKHRATIGDGYSGKLQSVIGSPVCAGSHRKPDDPELITIVQRCAWCGGDRERPDNDCARHGGPYKGDLR